MATLRHRHAKHNVKLQSALTFIIAMAIAMAAVNVLHITKII